MNLLREKVRRALRLMWSSSQEHDVDREVAALGVLKFRRGTEAERAQFIAAARDRLANLKMQTFKPYQLSGAASAIAFEEAMIERLERGEKIHNAQSRGRILRCRTPYGSMNHRWSADGLDQIVRLVGGWRCNGCGEQWARNEDLHPVDHVCAGCSGPVPTWSPSSLGPSDDAQSFLRRKM